MEVIASAVRQYKEVTSIQIGKEEVKLLLSTDDIILYVENPKDSTKKLLELIHKFSKVAEYKINIQKLVASLYTNTEATERDIGDSILCIIAPKPIKHLGRTVIQHSVGSPQKSDNTKK